MSGVDAVELEVRELVRRRGIDPFQDRAAVRRLVDEVVAAGERSLSSTLATLTSRRSGSTSDCLGGLTALLDEAMRCRRAI
jgi:hypothetical protein